MQLDHTITGLEAAVESQLRLSGPEAAEIGAQLMAALEPAIHQSLLAVAEMAAAEVTSQLPGQAVEVRLVDGDPELRVTSERPGQPPSPEEGGDEARLTVRLPASLKDIITDAANEAGDSINSFVVEALRGQARGRKGGMTRHRTTIEL